MEIAQEVGGRPGHGLPPAPTLSLSSSLSPGTHTWLPRYPSPQAAAASPEWSTSRDVCGWCSPSTQMMVPCESQEPGSSPLLAWVPACMWCSYLLASLTSLGSCPSLFHTQLDFVKKSLVPKGVLVEIMSNQAGTPEILWQVPTLFVLWTPLAIWQKCIKIKDIGSQRNSVILKYNSINLPYSSTDSVL